MDAVFNYIDRYKYAIIGTILFHIILFLLSNFTTITHPMRVSESNVEADVPFDEIEFDEEMMELLEIPPAEDKGQPQEILNAAADQSDTRQESREDFSTSDIDQQVENETRDLEQQYFDEWASRHEGENPSSADIQTDEDKEKSDRSDDRPDETIDHGGNNKAAGEVLVSYYLKNRKAYSLPKPGYTCNRSGTVKLDIKVDVHGDLKKVSFNASGSSNADECMIEQAIEYAKRSRFNYSKAAPSSQTGSITYKFVGQ